MLPKELLTTTDLKKITEIREEFTSVVKEKKQERNKFKLGFFYDFFKREQEGFLNLTFYLH